MKAFLKWLLVSVLVMIAAMALLLVADQVLGQPVEISGAFLLGFASVALSLVLSYWPKLRVDFATLTPTQKALVNLVAVILMAIAVFLMLCSGLIMVPGLVCSSAGLLLLGKLVITAVVSNQVTFIPSVKPSDVIAARDARDK